MKWLLPLILATCYAAPAYSQAQCYPRQQLVEILSNQYDEYVGGSGVVLNNQYIYEVWYSSETGTWSIVRTDASNTSCIMVSGNNWNSYEEGNNDDEV